MTFASISQLLQLINDSVASLQKICIDNELDFPSMDAPSFSKESEAFRLTPGIAESTKIAASACLQLVAILLPPSHTLYQLVTGDHLSAAVRVCLEANVSEILNEAGPSGLHTSKISEKCGIEQSKLSHIIRYLALNHCYREVRPDVFVNNRVSAMMDTGKAHKVIIADPQAKYDMAGFPALCSHHLDVNHKMSAFLWDALQDPEFGHSNELNKTVFARGLNTTNTYWGFLAQPENQFRYRRFGFAMQGIAAMQSPDMIFKAFDWDSLPPNSVIVDVGGGIGTATMPLAKRYTDMTIVIQDLPKTVEEAKRFWNSKFPEALHSGSVRIEDHDFFKPQPVLNASVFIIKQVLHNWSDNHIIKILQQLREVAKKDTVLLIIDEVIPYVCRLPGVEDNSYAAPEPLLPNFGPLNNAAYTLDMKMMCYFNAKEHTLLEFQSLFDKTGWKLHETHSISRGVDFLQAIQAVPI